MLFEPRRALPGGEVGARREQLALGLQRHAGGFPETPMRSHSHARANAQSRLIVIGETSSARAVSSTLMPAKNRRLTTSDRRGSSFARTSSASLTATTSRFSSGAWRAEEHTSELESLA